MISLNEVATLANQLSAIRDDSKTELYHGIIQISVGAQSVVLLQLDTFLTEFVEYDVQADKDIGIRLHQSIFGVNFETWIAVGDVIELRASMPEHHEYIVRQIQVETL
ncbi:MULTISPECIES: hypothetical protein [unclassified Sporosarcina]|uniref:hypothetical protein n=1 Tax=unclassified Sporosarcina TaxID=2647733 RepID=UPI00203F7AB4|nr:MULTISPECIES: hypothetical protein [unclassified Sporosarcina]GKV66731.1 hypothetical protein NCCP2331_28840 [Sporosarcina sp. NCCP-2331]GLB57086.1 hypothetical protein NCCP2378_28730 [Sporosarcina sp. NCCP-2378]